ncbi:hypothetical protein N7494_005493 [Penicillium frequentans]|uniref:Uncharacterized protein n=1 Tax=Penicillium frequentans TaxID=3151616 RepID=A0AAD6CUQ3_9EURO|nr:hypothetical protein N7494_005493 [Penicillium glabrum]
MKATYALETRLRRGPVVVVTVLGIFGDNYDWASFYALQLRQVRPAAPESLILSALTILPHGIWDSSRNSEDLNHGLLYADYWNRAQLPDPSYYHNGYRLGVVSEYDP